jgi:hypothetical protein
MTFFDVLLLSLLSYMHRSYGLAIKFQCPFYVQLDLPPQNTELLLFAQKTLISMLNDIVNNKQSSSSSSSSSSSTTAATNAQTISS